MSLFPPDLDSIPDEDYTPHPPVKLKPSDLERFNRRAPKREGNGRVIIIGTILLIAYITVHAFIEQLDQLDNTPRVEVRK